MHICIGNVNAHAQRQYKSQLMAPKIRKAQLIKLLFLEPAYVYIVNLLGYYNLYCLLVVASYATTKSLVGQQIKKKNKLFVQ